MGAWRAAQPLRLPIPHTLTKMTKTMYGTHTHTLAHTRAHICIILSGKPAARKWEAYVRACVRACAGIKAN